MDFIQLNVMSLFQIIGYLLLLHVEKLMLDLKRFLNNWEENYLKIIQLEMLIHGKHHKKKKLLIL